MPTTSHSPSPGVAPFPILYDDDDDDILTADHPATSVEVGYGPGPELEPEPKPYIGSYTRRNASGVTSTSFISSLPSELSITSRPAQPADNIDSRYTPRIDRPPFRSPASVRAMQMSSPPPLPAHDGSRERVKGSYKLATPSSETGRSDTVSASGSRPIKPQRDSVHSDYQALQSPRTTPAPQSHLPLVLLHVTILPTQLPYSHDFILEAMPDWLVENYRLLGEKLQDLVLMRRGILISHPRDEYDLLEERILESLELKTPRLLKCGHFLAADECIADNVLVGQEETNTTGANTGRGSRMSGGTITADEEVEWNFSTTDSDDASMCVDCHQHVMRPGIGVGAGTKRWDIKIYAANGLMRAGAWAAAWSEMERCDVEIAPWIPNDVRKDLDKRLQNERDAAQRKQIYAAELERQMAEEAEMHKKLEEEAFAKRKADQAQLQSRAEVETASTLKALQEKVRDIDRLRETLAEKIDEAKETIRLDLQTQAIAEADSIRERIHAIENALSEQQAGVTRDSTYITATHAHEHHPGRSQTRLRLQSHFPAPSEIPLGTLLKNYLVLLLQDTRNHLIVILAALVVFFATTAHSTKSASLEATRGTTLAHISESVPHIVITSTATATAASIATSVSVNEELVGFTFEEPSIVSIASARTRSDGCGRSTPLPPISVPVREPIPPPVASVVHEDHPAGLMSKADTDSPAPTPLEQTSNPINLFSSCRQSDKVKAMQSVAAPDQEFHSRER